MLKNDCKRVKDFAIDLITHLQLSDQSTGELITSKEQLQKNLP